MQHMMTKKPPRRYKTLNVRLDAHKEFVDAVFETHGGLHGKVLEETGHALKEHAKRLRAKLGEGGKR